LTSVHLVTRDAVLHGAPQLNYVGVRQDTYADSEFLVVANIAILFSKKLVLVTYRTSEER
jgi:hypothetical protein